MIRKAIINASPCPSALCLFTYEALSARAPPRRFDDPDLLEVIEEQAEQVSTT